MANLQGTDPGSSLDYLVTTREYIKFSKNEVNVGGVLVARFVDLLAMWSATPLTRLEFIRNDLVHAQQILHSYCGCQEQPWHS